MRLVIMVGVVTAFLVLINNTNVKKNHKWFRRENMKKLLSDISFVGFVDVLTKTFPY